MLKLVIVSILLGVAVATPGKIRPKPPNARIINGHDADIKDYPYQLSYQLDDIHHCGAAMIAPNWAISAGHCVQGLMDWPATMLAGTSDAITFVGGQRVSIKRSILHPNFGPTDSAIDYDIGLLELAENITVSTAKAIPLPPAGGTVPYGDMAAITGWGSMAGEIAPTTLQEVDIPIVSQEECETRYAQDFHDRFFCIGLLDVGGVGSCVGDSGSPVEADGVIAGIVSWGLGDCDDAYFPGVYTNVYYFVDWIKETTGI